MSYRPGFVIPPRDKMKLVWSPSDEVLALSAWCTCRHHHKPPSGLRLSCPQIFLATMTSIKCGIWLSLIPHLINVIVGSHDERVENSWWQPWQPSYNRSIPILASFPSSYLNNAGNPSVTSFTSSYAEEDHYGLGVAVSKAGEQVGVTPPLGFTAQ